MQDTERVFGETGLSLTCANRAVVATTVGILL